MMARLSLIAFLLPAVFGYKASADASTGIDSSSLLQKPSGKEANASVSADAPHIIGLRRESVPIYRRGKIASFKTSYSGVLSVGYPPQDFRVVFDTGSAHIILPAVECKSEACLANNRRHYDQRKSTTSLPINADGSIVHQGDNGEQVTIGFGTGDITGEFAKDTVCFGKGQTKDEVLHLKKEQQHHEEIAALIKQESLRIHDYPEETQMSSSDGTEVVADHSPMCMEMNMIVAIEMSTVPFKTFKFDGILGLSLDGLAMNRNFSTFDMLVRNGLARRPHFGVFLTDSEDLEPSEVAFGGADAQRMLEPITWSKVYRPDLGYWVVPITSVRVDGVELDLCKDGTCRGVVDTGTSHLGVPGPYDKELANMLKVDAGDLLDCRLAKSPKLEIDLDGGKTIELFASSYMRRLPLREGVSVSSEKGVTLDDKDKKSKKTEVVFERPGYVQLNFGASKEEMKCIRPKDPVQCHPEAANRRDDIYGDKFHVHVQGEEVCVNRTDIPGGWGMDLTFYCPEPWVVEKEGKVEPGMEAIYLAELELDEERCYNTFAELSCPNTREFTVRSADHKKVCVTRKYLPAIKAKVSDVLHCKVAIDETLVGLEEVVIGPQESHDALLKCVTPAKPVICEKDAGNKRKDNFPDSFEIISQNDQICAKRMDGGQTSWALNLIIFCRPEATEAAEETRTIDREEVHLQQGENNDPPPVQEESPEPVPEKVTRHCSPRLMAVNLPEPLGPKLFILGEPVLHRYYTVYDWEDKRVGFSLANTQRNTMDMSTLGRGTLPKEVDMLLMQRHMEVRPPQLRP